jgi:hypothetical protein
MTYRCTTICTEIDNSTKKSKSFKKDIELLQSRFNLGVEELLANTSVLIGSLKEPFNGRDGIMESIMFCLYNIVVVIDLYIISIRNRTIFMKIQVIEKNLNLGRNYIYLI